MAKGFKHGAGGGTSLNFKVVGNPQPENPKENTIWVDTDAEITGWVFAAQQPETATEGMVWFSTGTTSAVEFNALKKNGIHVYPFSAKQYLDGTWAYKEAKCYQGGAWVGLAQYLYNYGYVDKTWTASGLRIESGGNAQAPAVSIDGNGAVTAKQNGNYCGGIFYYPVKVDLTPYRTLTFSGKLYEGSGSNPLRSILAVWSAFGSTYLENNAARKTSPVDGVTTLDVSALSGEHYIGFGVYHTGNYVKMDYLRLE